MSLPATDDFNRGAGGVGANWTNQLNSLVINSGQQCKGGTAGDYNQGFWNADVFPNDQYSQVFGSTGNTGFGGVQVRASGTGASRNGYYVLYGVGASRLSKVVNNTITDLIGPGGIGDPGVGPTVKITVEGTSIKAFYNGVQQGATQTDSALASGSAGIIIYDTNAIVDNWEGGSLGAPDPVFPVTRFSPHHYRRDVYRWRPV